MKPIVFYNHFHNGDIHISREFIKDIMRKVNTTFEYYHNCGPKPLLDIDIVCKSTTQSNLNLTNFQIIHEDKDTILINTWYNVNFEGIKKYGCTLKALYDNFKMVYQYLNIQLEPLDYYIPSIDFTKYNVESIDDFIKNNQQKKIYISNGVVQSGQSVNFDFNGIINKLSVKFPDYLFIISNDDVIRGNNIIYSKNIIKTDGSDLIENSYLMSYCDMIIGRCSGTFSFGLIKDNLISDKKQTWVGICNLDPKFGIEEFLNQNKTFHWFNFFDPQQIYNELEKIISESYGNS